ncbi:hypothetical protein ACTMQE_13340, partial [Escherichia coli]
MDKQDHAANPSGQIGETVNTMKPYNGRWK